VPDIAIRFDTATRRADIAVENGDWAIDRTPVTPLLIRLGSDRRAEPDDVLPEALDEQSVTQASRFDPRRGWVGDALDPAGRRIGSRLWLLERAKRTDGLTRDDTLLAAVGYAEQATSDMAEDGVPVAVDAAWVGREMLALRCSAGGISLTVPVAIGGGRDPWGGEIIPAPPTPPPPTALQYGDGSPIEWDDGSTVDFA
jgi:phage gp46-like protein